MKTYECCPAFGWGVRGACVSGIKRKMKELGLQNEEPEQWPKLHQLVTHYLIKVSGEDSVIQEFESYMKMMGYDDRTQP